MKIGYLNQIQTQAYSAFVNSKDNIFLGASEGSGKFSLAVLAISQVLQQQKKAVLIVSHSVIAQKKTHSLAKLFSKKKVARTYEDLNKDAQVLAVADLIVTTAEAWDVLSRRWKSRKGFS
jgi:pre-mRNA-splicing helicase BRR2